MIDHVFLSTFFIIIYFIFLIVGIWWEHDYERKESLGHHEMREDLPKTSSIKIEKVRQDGAHLLFPKYDKGRVHIHLSWWLLRFNRHFLYWWNVGQRGWGPWTSKMKWSSTLLPNLFYKFQATECTRKHKGAITHHSNMLDLWIDRVQ